MPDRLPAKRLHLCVLHSCLCCGQPSDRYLLHAASRVFTGHCWCPSCWERVHRTLRDAGLLQPERMEAWTDA
jgi:hypothetical protein